MVEFHFGVFWSVCGLSQIQFMPQPGFPVSLQCSLSSKRKLFCPLYMRTLFSPCSPSFLLCAKDSPAHRTASTFAFLAGSSNSRFAGCVSPGLVQAAWWARSLLCPPEHTPFWPEHPGDPVGLNLPSTQFCNFPAVLKLATIPCLFPTYVSEALPIYK